MLLIWVLDTAHQALVVHFNFVYFVKGLLDPDLLVTLPRYIIPFPDQHGADIESFQNRDTHFLPRRLNQCNDTSNSRAPSLVS